MALTFLIFLPIGIAAIAGIYLICLLGCLLYYEAWYRWYQFSGWLRRRRGMKEEDESR